MKAGDKRQVWTLRLIAAAIKDRDIQGRTSGRDAGVGDAQIVEVLAKMVKQREESAKAFEDGKRPELAAKERAEMEVILEFLPKQLDDAAITAAAREAITATGAAPAAFRGPDCYLPASSFLLSCASPLSSRISRVRRSKYPSSSPTG